MNMGTGFEEIDIGSGKLLIYVVFGANRWEFEKLDQAEWEERIPVSAQGSWSGEEHHHVPAEE